MRRIAALSDHSSTPGTRAILRLAMHPPGSPLPARTPHPPGAPNAVDRIEPVRTPPVVLIAEMLAPSAMTLLGDDVEIRHVDGTDRPALLAAVADADALLVR